MSPDTAADPSLSSTTFAGWWGSLTSTFFWAVLLIAGAMYAGVALAPKILSWHQWQDRHVSQRYQLLEREQQLDALEQMVAALDRDPQFVAELARLDMDTAELGADTIPVDEALAHDPRQRTATMKVPPLSVKPLWEPWLQVLATQESLRTGLLAAAAILAIAAFTFLHDGSETLRARRENQPESALSVWEFWRRRYRSRSIPAVDPEARST